MTVASIEPGQRVAVAEDPVEGPGDGVGRRARRVVGAGGVGGVGRHIESDVPRLGPGLGGLGGGGPAGGLGH
ncbi:MAG TPA: hypothetical protein VJ456_07340, partial [Acidimicrobiia bacterium]|nr:hypothetical protein [Acidimicrobiia bacterium]